MDRLKSLKISKSREGHPLYLTVRDTLRQAIESGIFRPGQRMPSTKQLSEYMEVSLVTAHRALQELVGNGVLQRSQGRGTFVHEEFRDRMRVGGILRLGLILHAGVSFGDYHYGQILEGIRGAAAELSADIVLLRLREDVRNECGGFLMVSPTPAQVDRVIAASRRRPIVVVDSDMPASEHAGSVQVDNSSLAQQAVEHLVHLGHSSIGYVGADDDHHPNGSERWNGFLAACEKHGINPRQQHTIRALSWRLDERESMALVRMLGSEDRPSAIFCAGFSFAMDLYRAASAAGVKIPSQLSVVGVDDAPSAGHLAPALTTIRQPLIEMGKSAVEMMVDLIEHPQSIPRRQLLPFELMVRESTASPVEAMK